MNGPGLHGGPIPPEATTFEVTGYITRPAIARNPDYTIHTDDGHKFVIANSDFQSGLLSAYYSKEGEAIKPRLSFNGFLLKNGEGTFYPIVVKDSTGNVLNSPAGAIHWLKNHQTISWSVVFYTTATLWLINVVAQMLCVFGFLRRNRRYIKDCSLHSS